MFERACAAIFVRLSVMLKSTHSERGATATEYAIIAAIGVGVALAMWAALSGTAQDWVERIGDEANWSW